MREKAISPLLTLRLSPGADQTEANSRWWQHSRRRWRLIRQEKKKPITLLDQKNDFSRSFNTPVLYKWSQTVLALQVLQNDPNRHCTIQFSADGMQRLLLFKMVTETALNQNCITLNISFLN